MTKTTLALAAALLAGTTLTSAANAGGVRVGFGFPLGSFIAHSNQSYSGEGYGSGRNCHKPRYQLAASTRPQLLRLARSSALRRLPLLQGQQARGADSKARGQTDYERRDDDRDRENAGFGCQRNAVDSEQKTTTTAVLDKETDKAATTKRRRRRRSRHPRSRRSPRSRRPRRAERPNRRRSRYLPPSAYAAGSRLPSPAWSTCPASKVNRLTPRQTAASALGNVSPNSYRP